MEDPIEQRLRALMQGDQADDSENVDDARMERVLHKIHLRGGALDLVRLFANWGWVISEGGARGLRHARPTRRSMKSSPDPSNNQRT
ncbi:hypothetical protein [uncultured Halopseudomonas sp.]|uniref:hypothetical protein n=1 Tax=uncultured Halopseudomonas sp. TaxID=2901193 RepID=UPI0030EE40C7|tara:strand:- start:21066 stop:21326 length:261 start_codon:yes stop_codon:yes gene_type:complete